jgi:N-acetylmuramoyl-L-alanine amidase
MMGTTNYYHSRSPLFLVQRYVFAFLLLLFLFLPATPLMAQGYTSLGAENTLESQYLFARKNYTDLKSNSSRNVSREEWLKNARDFRKIFLTDSKSDYAPKCLFMLGKIYKEMYIRFKNKLDLDEAISYFSDEATIFPKSSLGDDALWLTANLYLDNLHNPKKAAEALSRIVTDFPNGDMHARAVKLLEVLSQKYNIPLPPVMVGKYQPAHLIDVLPVKYWSSNDYTRVVVNASGPVRYKEKLLEKSGNQPRRLFIDFYNSYIEPKYRAPVPIEDGLLKRIRTGQYNSNTVRVVLDIESISSYKVFSLADPFRVIIDVRGKERNVPPVPQAQISNKPPQPVKAPEQTPSQIVVLRQGKKYPVDVATLENQKNRNSSVPSTSEKSITLAQQLGLRVRTIVLDPGHGGKDPGAIAFGLKEKDIVLKVAKMLAPILEKRLRCKVILTRTTDVFIPLEERTAIANTHDADLFVSLHINASPSEKAHGIETYYLNLTTNPEAMRVAARENATSTHQMSDLQNILSDIMKNSKINESARLAELVNNSIVTGLKKNFSDIKSMGVKQAPFYVLIGAEMPAILVEMSFITNKDDVKHLQNNHFLENIASDISSGIQSYISSNTAGL